MEEDCAEPSLAQTERQEDDNPLSINRKSCGQHIVIDEMNTGQVNELLKQGSESPLIGKGKSLIDINGAANSDIKRSFKDVASYLTPNRSSSKSMNQTS